MTDFFIQLPGTSSSDPDSPVPIRIGAGRTIFTRLIRPGDNSEAECVVAEPAQLAFWIVDNWWRLRWECSPLSLNDEWRLRHDLSSLPVYAWPRLMIWGDGDEVWLSSSADPPGVVGPVRYLTTELMSVSASGFEDAVDSFLSQVAHDTRGFGSDRAALRAQVDALFQERADTALAAWRKLEAQSGFDVDKGPDELITRLLEAQSAFQGTGVVEAVMAAPGIASAEVLKDQIAAAKQSGFAFDPSGIADRHRPQSLATAPAWVEAETVATEIRHAIDARSDPISNRQLADLLGTDVAVLYSRRNRHDLRYGLRLVTSNSAQRLLLHSRRNVGRRFEAARALGDAIGYRNDELGPLADTNTRRQKFQRAFAQALLCPFDALMSFISTRSPDEEDIQDAAEHFDVSEWLILSVLKNKDVITGRRFEELLAAF